MASITFYNASTHTLRLMSNKTRKSQFLSGKLYLCVSFIGQIVENGASGEMRCLFPPLAYLSVRQFDLLELIVQPVPLARVLGQYGVGLGKDLVAEEVVHVHHLVIAGNIYTGQNKLGIKLLRMHFWPMDNKSSFRLAVLSHFHMPLIF